MIRLLKETERSQSSQMKKLGKIIVLALHAELKNTYCSLALLIIFKEVRNSACFFYRYLRPLLSHYNTLFVTLHENSSFAHPTQKVYK